MKITLDGIDLVGADAYPYREHFYLFESIDGETASLALSEVFTKAGFPSVSNVVHVRASAGKLREIAAALLDTADELDPPPAPAPVGSQADESVVYLSAA